MTATATLSRLCTIDGCELREHARGLCPMHYQRQRLTGNVGLAQRIIAERGAGYVDADGYRVLQLPHHPLGAPNVGGRVREHRVVLFDAIGPSTHPCRWCGIKLCWQGVLGAKLIVDHVDSNRLNNDLSNLVPSCSGCNTRRAYA